jgi:hypothetical protein
MDSKTIQSISDKVYKRFPETDGKKPRVRKQRKPDEKDSKAPPTFLLTYKGSGQGPGGKIIPRWVRVVANERGKILKISTSRG